MMAVIAILLLLILFVAIGILIVLYLMLMQRDEDKSETYFSDFFLYDGQQLLFNIQGKLKFKKMRLKDTQQVVGTLSFVDKKGKPTDVPDGHVSVNIVNAGDAEPGAIATASYEDEGNKVTVKAVGPGVAALVIAVTNAAGENLPFEDVAIEVTAGDAVSGTVVFGEPTEQEEA